ncbi:hypothetical protein OG746_29280 [Streptomyces sp. NBC_01016]|nr:hypothetical protein [Streptomyces sp. NBC_01016]MCX4832831.1 hypothetical protein [Streptomyces sp. NBC_01016]
MTALSPGVAAALANVTALRWNLAAASKWRDRPVRERWLRLSACLVRADR